jgi:hypothetical protein
MPMRGKHFGGRHESDVVITEFYVAEYMMERTVRHIFHPTRTH